MTATPLRAAVVGCGIIGLNHARAIERVPGVEVAALVDPVPGAAQALADAVAVDAPDSAAVRAAQFDALGEALDAGVDVVVICTPSGLHVAQAEAAVEAGAHVVIEKPLDVDLGRARRIAELAERAASSGILVSVISQHRFDPASIAVARAARSGELGRITSAVASVAWWRSQEYYDSGQWRGTWELDGGGALMNQGVHTVDLLLWFLGRPVEVSAMTGLLAHERVEVEDVAAAVVRFESGALAVLHATTAAYPGLSVRIQVHGSRGSAVIDDDRLARFLVAGAADDDSGAGVADRAALEVPAGELAGAAPPPDAFVEGHARQWRDIVDAVARRRAPGVTVADALLALAVVRSVYVSAALGRPVLVDEVLAGAHDDVRIGTEIPA